MEFKKKSVTVGGSKTWYWEKNSRQSPVIIFLHGFPGNHLGLVELASHVSDKYRIILPDLPACGQSEDLKGAHTLKAYSKWLDLFLEKLAIPWAIVIGHSFGARVAFMFSIEYPKRVKKLVLITPVPKMDGVIPRLASLKGTIAKILPGRLKKVWLSNRFYQYASYMIVFKTASPKKRREISTMDAKELKTLNPQATIEIFDEFYHSDLIPLAKGVVQESLVIAGNKDEIATLRSVKELVLHNMPNVSLKIIEDAGHLMPLEEPSKVMHIIESWLLNPKS